MHLKRGELILLAVVFTICFLLIPSVSSTFSVQGESLQKNYQGGSIISGNIQLTLKNEPADSRLTSNFQGNISLLDFLKANNMQKNVNYNCSYKDCLPHYKDISQIESISLDTATERVIGFAITDKDVAIEAIDFSITTDAESSCENPLSIVPLDNEEYTITSNQYSVSSAPCSDKIYGCFDNSLSSSEYQNVLLSTQPYCEKIELPSAPAYEVSAQISATANTSSITFELFDKDTNFIKDCKISSIETGNRVFSCIINYSNPTEEEHSLCIYSSSDKEEYSIRSEREEEICGGAGVGEETRDYEIYARALPYSPIRNLSLSKSYLDVSGNTLQSDADFYIDELYNRDCSNTCVIPFIIKGNSQTIEIKNITLKYTSQGSVLTSSSIYNIEKRPSLINSIGSLNLDISKAKFTIPVSSTLKTLQIYIRNSALFPKPLSINITPGFDFSLYPQFALVGVETLFTASTNQNITSSSWDFGDGTIKQSNSKVASHRYLNSTSYELKVSLTNSKGVTTTKTFTIVSGNSTLAFKDLLNKSKSNMQRVNNQTNAFPPQVKTVILARLNLTKTTSDLAALEIEFNNATSDAEKIEVINKLVALNVPENIRYSSYGILPLAVGLSTMNADYVKLATGQNISDSKVSELEENIIYWNNQNYDSKVDFKYLAVDIGEQENILFTHFKITPSKIKEQPNPAYLILDYPLEEITKINEFSMKSLEDGTLKGVAITFTDSPIEFMIEDQLEVSDLAAYIIPTDISSLGDFIERPKWEFPDLPKGRLWLWIILLIIGFFVIYILLQEWYKRRYESYLFKNPDDLYNVLTFIYNSRRAGVSDDTSWKKLSDTGWTGEQLTYAFKKIDGKRTGMLEIPIFRPFERRKMREEIAKRQEQNSKIY